MEFLHSQNTGSLHGTILDAKTNDPIIGAYIVLSGTSTGAVSDFEGNFELKIPLNSELTISYVGYETKKIKVTSFSQQTIHLSDLNHELDEMVVIGYAVQKRVMLQGQYLPFQPKK